MTFAPLDFVATPLVYWTSLRYILSPFIWSLYSKHIPNDFRVYIEQKVQPQLDVVCGMWLFALFTECLPNHLSLQKTICICEKHSYNHTAKATTRQQTLYPNTQWKVRHTLQRLAYKPNMRVCEWMWVCAGLCDRMFFFSFDIQIILSSGWAAQ